MNLSTRSRACDEYFESRCGGPDRLLMKVVEPDRIRAVLHSREAVRAPLMSKLAGESMVWIDGADWLLRRKLSQPVFLPRNEIRQKGIVDWVVSGLMDRLTAASERGESILITDEFLRMTTRFLYRFAFDIDLPADHDRAPVVSDYFAAISRLSFWIQHRDRPLDLKDQQDVRIACARMDAEIDRIMRSEPGSGSLLGSLIEARVAGKQTDAQVRDEVRGLFIAGTETTSLTLAWACLLLGEFPEWQERVARDLDDPGPDPLLEAVLKETMRLYPAAPFMTRIVESACDLGFGPLSANTELLVSIYHTHRNPDHWPDPDRFDPQRFLGEPDHHRYAWLPFGGGRHLCIGQRVAVMEAADTLRSILRRFRIHRDDHDHVEALLGVTLKPSRSLRVRLERRGSR